MAAISAQQVKELRQQTGAGILDCKEALEISEGDFDKAVVYLREKGMAAAASFTVLGHFRSRSSKTFLLV